MRSGRPANPRAISQRGFGFLLVLFAIAALGLLLAGTGQVWHTTVQREKEAELLFIGNQFRQAIGSYYRQTPGAEKQLPLRLEDLLEDTRFLVPRRHLRKLYRDPMTGTFEWGLVKVGNRIAGVYSLAPSSTLQAVFQARDAALQDTTRHDQWVFSFDMATPPQAPASGASAATPGRVAP